MSVRVWHVPSIVSPRWPVSSSIYMNIYGCKFIVVYMCIYIHTHTHISIHTYIYTHIYIHICIYIYIYTCTYIYRLVAVGVIDILPSGLSSVYLFYDPDEKQLNLGQLCIYIYLSTHTGL
jgi:arginyl-tRNA--protein-N-Asp/Glu arginylyltransferase